jgi:cytidylate kinase
MRSWFSLARSSVPRPSASPRPCFLVGSEAATLKPAHGVPVPVTPSGCAETSSRGPDSTSLDATASSATVASSYALAVPSARAPVFVIVSGPPASGKSTLAPTVASALGLPLIAKDTIKDALMSVLNVADVDASRQLGRASVNAMLAVAAQSPIGAVIESNFHRSIAVAELEALPGNVIELFCRCRADVAWDRYRSRARTRHAGHFDHDRTRDELWNEEVAEPVAGAWPLLEVDTNTPVDVAAVVQFVDAHCHADRAAQ